MHRAVAALTCVMLGCTTTTWKPMSPQLDVEGREVFIVTDDRAAIVEDAGAKAGRVGGHVLRMWQLPPGTHALLVAETPSENARRAGWVELPAGNFFSADASNVRWVRVTETTPTSKLVIGAVCVLGFFAALALLPLVGAAAAG